MRLTMTLAIGAMLAAGCTERSPSSDDASETSGVEPSSASTPTSTPEPMSSSAGSGPATEMSSEAGEPVLPYPDCRPKWTNGVADCNSRFGYGEDVDVFLDFACEVCLCAEGPCASDGECVDPGAAAVPRCLISPNGEVNACYLVCERDEDCPPEMVCILRQGGDEHACYWPWLKPQCCEQGGDAWCS